uniref:Uncharacterized protein n=1 Tax=Arundo donax TaxID=35708 RepID=A0A0A9FWB8_ARUDO
MHSRLYFFAGFQPLSQLYIIWGDNVQNQNHMKYTFLSIP